MAWLNMSEGYVAFGYDGWFTSEAPVWFCQGETARAVTADAVEWMQDGIEVDAHRVVKVFYVDSESKMQQDFELRTVIAPKQPEGPEPITGKGLAQGYGYIKTPNGDDLRVMNTCACGGACAGGTVDGIDDKLYGGNA